MKKLLAILIVTALFAGSVMMTSCAFLDNVAKNVSSIANLVNCEYALKNVSNVTVAGVNVKNVTNGNISTTDVVKLVAAITTKSVPLALDVNINVKNPTTTSAKLTTLDWALDLAATEFATGATNQAYNISPNTTSTVPLAVNTDIYRLFSSDGINSLKAFASSFTKDGTSSQVGLRVRPSIQVAGQTYKSPNYISIMKPAANSSSNTNTGSGTGSGSGSSTGKTNIKKG